MARISRNIWIAAIAAVTLGACSAGENSAAQTAGPSEADATNYLSEVYFDNEEGGVVLGNPDAAVTLIEYASLTCGHCKTFHDEVIPTIKRDYVETGKIKFIFREFPTDPVNIAIIGFTLARCAGPEGYFAALDDFFGNQNEIFSEAREGRALEALQAYGERNGTPKADFETCINSEEQRRAISKSFSAGQADGINSTPSLVLNGEALVTADARTAEGMSAIINAALAETAPLETQE